MTLAPGQWAWAAIAILLAALLRGFTGFGFAIAAVPLASLVLPPQTSVAAVLVMQTAIGLRDCVVERRMVDWRSVSWLTAGTLGGTPLGVLGLTFLPVPWVRLGLGVLVLAAMAVTWRPVRHRDALGHGWAVLAGFCAGISNGLAAMSGPPAIVYFLAVERDRARARASQLAFFPLAAGLALVPAAWNGLVHWDALVIAGFGLPLMLLGGHLGGRLFLRFGQRAYRPAAIVALGLTAVATILRGAVGLLP